MLSRAPAQSMIITPMPPGSGSGAATWRGAAGRAWRAGGEVWGVGLVHRQDITGADREMGGRNSTVPKHKECPVQQPALP
jgi:hypothetical protein